LIKRIAFHPFKGHLLRLARWRALEKFHIITPHLEKHHDVLDIGSGNGVLCHMLQTTGYRVTPLDVKHASLVDGVNPVLYDGKALPFKDKHFDVSLLITMLHHTPCPKRILMEARRVSRRLIVMEEIYSHKLHKKITHLIDSVFNLEFKGHPHSNKSDVEWRNLFHRLNLDLYHAHYSNSAIVLKRVTYILRHTYD